MAAVETPSGPVASAAAPLSVAVVLEDEVDAGRGAMIAAAEDPPAAGRELEATVCWMGETPARAGGRLAVKHTTRTLPARLEAVHGTLDVTALAERPGADSLALNDIGRVTLRCAGDLAFDPYRRNRATGAFILIDETTNDTVGAGMIADVR